MAEPGLTACDLLQYQGPVRQIPQNVFPGRQGQFRARHDSRTNRFGYYSETFGQFRRFSTCERVISFSSSYFSQSAF
jgi:hypothetical protein